MRYSTTAIGLATTLAFAAGDVEPRDVKAIAIKIPPQAADDTVFVD